LAEAPHQLLCLFSLRSPVRWQAGGSLNLIVGRGPVAVKGHEALAFVWASQPRGISFPNQEKGGLVDNDKEMQFEGKWDQMKGRVKEAWGDLTDDDLDRTEGKWDQIVGRIKEKTGESVDVIQDKLKKLLD